MRAIGESEGGEGSEVVRAIGERGWSGRNS